jgi:glucans biosynthesis protein C
MTQIASDPLPVADTRAAVTGRLHFFDHLRAFIILLVILLHASMTYMAFPPEWWYVIEPENSLVFTALVLLVDVANMQILFFIAGFFAYPSIEKYGSSRFMRQKLLRLGLPWLFAVIFLAPLVTYLIPVTRGFAGSYLEFWTRDFWGPFYQQSVYWFLGILLLLFAVFAAFYHNEPSLQAIARRAQAPTVRLFAGFWAITTLWYLLANMIMPADTWLNAVRLFVFQPARLLLYVAYFILGIYADRRGWFRAGGYRPPLDAWVGAALLSAVAYLAVRWFWLDGSFANLAAQAALFNAMCLSVLMASTALFQHYVNKQDRIWSSFSRNTYGIYYLHPLILYPLAFVALSIPGSIYMEVALLTLATVLIAWAISALLLTRWPGLREIF